MSSLAEMLADALNGVNNAAASTVSAPVDLISYGLRKAGLGNVIGSAPVGGSNWMQQKGLTRPTNGLAGDIGEFAGNVLPIAAAAKAPQIAGGLLKMGENALAPSTLGSQRGAIVYHGSPHTFDAFDMSKIGTGEGAQAYGHGLYLADGKGVAQSYANMEHPVLGRDPRDAVTDLRQNWQTNPNPRQLKDEEVRFLMRDFPELASHVDNPDVVRNITRVVNGTEPGGTVTSEAIYAMRGLDKQLPPKPQGNLYKVDLPDEAIAKMLDWDKPLSQQSPSAHPALGGLIERVLSKKAEAGLDASELQYWRERYGRAPAGDPQDAGAALQ